MLGRRYGDPRLACGPGLGEIARHHALHPLDHELPRIATLERIAVGQDAALGGDRDRPGQAGRLVDRVLHLNRRPALWDRHEALDRLGALQHLQDVGLAEMRRDTVFACLDRRIGAKNLGEHPEIARRGNRPGLLKLNRCARQAAARRDLDTDRPRQRTATAPHLDDEKHPRDCRERQDQTEAAELAHLSIPFVLSVSKHCPPR